MYKKGKLVEEDSKMVLKIYDKAYGRGRYYPIETIVYGIKNNRKDFIYKGRKIIRKRGIKYVGNQKINTKEL